RVVGNRKRARSPRQSPAFVQHPVVWGWLPEAVPAVRCHLEALRIKFERGEREALLDAIDLCLRCDCKPPYWARGAGSTAIQKCNTNEVLPLGEAFGVAPHVSKLLDDQRKRDAFRWRVIA